eukprot:m.481120 g.481120  ORF g.481120 m.481120 type:complete len:62 (+) comp55701_c0_seq1:347-532(+)
MLWRWGPEFLGAPPNMHPLLRMKAAGRSMHSICWLECDVWFLVCSKCEINFVDVCALGKFN